ncbi:hypothetical protein [Halopiger thermotolerans]
MTRGGRKNDQAAGGTNDAMLPDPHAHVSRARGIESIQSGLLLFGFTLLLALFMGAVVFLNGSG